MHWNNYTVHQLGVQSRFYWPGWKRDVEDWCRACDESCQSRRAPMQTILPGRPFQRMAMDSLGPLPKIDRGNKYILVICNYFTKWMEAIPIPDMELLQYLIWVPDQIHTDQGHNFESMMFKNICRLLNIEKTSYDSIPPTF